MLTHLPKVDDCIQLSFSTFLDNEGGRELHTLAQCDDDA
jgi:hypothetical protein